MNPHRIRTRAAMATLQELTEWMCLIADNPPTEAARVGAEMMQWNIAAMQRTLTPMMHPQDRAERETA